MNSPSSEPNFTLGPSTILPILRELFVAPFIPPRPTNAQTKSEHDGPTREELLSLAYLRFKEWHDHIKLKNYQYEVTTGLYMMSPNEKIFASIFFTFFFKALLTLNQLQMLSSFPS